MSVWEARAVGGFMEMRQNEPCRVAGMCIPMIPFLLSVLFCFFLYKLPYQAAVPQEPPHKSSEKEIVKVTMP